MTVLTCAITGKSITLLKEIANSGEAKVWRTNQNGYLAKIYHSPTSERVQKLAVMIDHPPTEPNSHLHHVSFAWPKSVLKNAQGNFVGFLMPEIKGGKELIDVYNPQRRKKLELEIDWRFLHTTALNIASIIAALHEAGYVLGDIKPQNILVNNRALPSIIDTDSFQIKNPRNSKVYRCLVGSEGYTPPELMGRDFDIIEQTEVHDRFRLGVIIYQLLFGGNSPFQGKWTGAGETPEPNELIRRGLWVYGANTLITAAARTIPLEIVYPDIQQCFLKCFNDGHKNPNSRPTAREWLEALKVGNDNLTICGRVDSHYYSRTFGNCYWCDRSTNLGVDIFPGVVKAKPSILVQPTQSQASQTNQLVNSPRQVSQPPVYRPQNQPVTIPAHQTTIPVKNTKLIKLLIAAILGFIGTQFYGCMRYGVFPVNPISIIASLPSGIFLERTITGHSNSVRSVAYSPDGQTLASGSEDKTIKIWRLL
ncbi:MAG: protein kinase domain-containing protein [Dolichospermum sp.]